MKPKIEAGQEWVTRSGDRVYILGRRRNTSKFSPWVVERNDGATYACREDGRCYSDFDNPLDLVRLVTHYEDWPIDAKVKCRSIKEDSWVHRHFAGVDKETGRPRAWAQGKTSWTENQCRTTIWNYMELVEDDS